MNGLFLVWLLLRAPANWDRLSPPRFTTVKSSVDLTGVKEDPTGDFDIRGLGRAVNTDMANQVLIKTWIDRACTSLSIYTPNHLLIP